MSEQKTVNSEKSGFKSSLFSLFTFHFSRRAQARGFTLVEMIVSVALFSVVMLICVGALLALVGANRKVHALQSVMNNLNVTLDGMVRAIRMGSNFHCGSGATNVTHDCANGDIIFAFEPFGSTSADIPWVYTYDPTTKRLYRSENGGTPIAITAPEIIIDSMTFYVVGSTRGCTVSPCDTAQPKVVIVIKGTAPVVNSKARSTFHIQVTATQRLLDL
ncbi:type II secretion system protein [Candidatus Kaiserbacteria bacterium]|nr:type II secretion system protein [Candidatus Kaiserbacteria bacterium]